jgi:hypothetical protein
VALRNGHQSGIRKEPVMEKGTTFVGLDVHKEAINVAMLLPGETRPPRGRGHRAAPQLAIRVPP